MHKTLKREEIRDFDIMLSASNSWLSRTIRKFIKSKISHSAIFFRLDGILYVHESERYGLTNTAFSHYEDPKYDIWIARPRSVNITNDDRKALLHEALSSAGHKPYDFANLLIHQPIKAITKALFGKPLWLGKRKKKADKRFICSERTAYVMNMFFGIEPSWNDISTEHFMNSDKYEIFKYES